LRNCSGRIETLWTCSGTVEDGVAAIQTHLILKFLLTMCFVTIARVSDPAISLHERSWAEVLVLVPPVGWTGGRATCTKDALIETVKFLAIFRGLKELAMLGRIVILEEGLDGLVLFVEKSEVRNKVFHDIQVRERIYLRVLIFTAVNATNTGEGILAVDVHGARAADTLST